MRNKDSKSLDDLLKLSEQTKAMTAFKKFVQHFNKHHFKHYKDLPTANAEQLTYALLAVMARNKDKPLRQMDLFIALLEELTEAGYRI